jgi:sn-glycerol 3-phosphate transport system permease protein
MVERRPWLTAFSHLVLIIGVLIVAFPVYITFVASTQTSDAIVQSPMPMLPGAHLIENYTTALTGTRSGSGSHASVGRMMVVSLITALVISLGKITISLISAFALVYFRFPFRMAFFWAIFITLMLPVEVRIGPTYKVVSDLGMLNSYAGLTIPDELVEAARVDGAGPMRFFKDILVPLSRTSMAALFVIQFIYGWNQYLWPLLVTTEENMYPVVIGIKQMISGGDAQTEWNIVMATAMLAMLPPALVVMLMQKWFVKGLVDTEK